MNLFTLEKRSAAFLLPILLSMLFFVSLTFFTNAQAIISDSSISPISKEVSKNSSQTINKITVQLTQLEDNAGLKYIGGVVQAKDVIEQLTQMQTHLGEQFERYRKQQKTRDHDQLHITVVNPFEYRELSELQQHDLLNKTLMFDINGLGQVTHVIQERQQTFFVVVSSQSAQQLRESVGLKKKDFHITLGFYPQDIYGVKKDISTLITQ